MFIEKKEETKVETVAEPEEENVQIMSRFMEDNSVKDLNESIRDKEVNSDDECKFFKFIKFSICLGSPREGAPEEWVQVNYCCLIAYCIVMDHSLRI